MLTTLKNELKQREFIAESAELEDEILIDEMDDDILLDDEEDMVFESSMAEIEKAIDLIPVDDTDLAYEEMDELLEACCGEIEEDAKAESDAPVQGDPGDDEAVNNEECKFCDEEDDQDYNIYRGRGVSHAGGYCESDDIEDIVEDEEDEFEGLSEDMLVSLYFE